MQVILKEDVENLGFKDDIVTVKNGYGRNFLIPTRKGILATASAVKQLEETLRQRARKEEKEVGDAKVIADKIAGLNITIATKVGKGGKLFGSISNINLAEQLGKSGVQIEKKYIKVPGNNVKKAGKYTATVRLHRTLSTDLAFEIVSDEK